MSVRRALKIEQICYNKLGKMGNAIAHTIKMYVRVVYACDISYKAIIDSSCVFPHQDLGVVIGDNVVIGKNCIIRQNVTIGGKGIVGEPFQCPTIGNDCMIGSGAVLLGGINIGNNVIIGANAVVLNDIPDNAIVAGVPGRIVKMKV